MRTPLHVGPAIVLLFCVLLPLTARAQAFTNSATLTATLSGTNLIVTYSLMNTQGWVTLFQAGSLLDLATKAQPFDLAPAPVSGQGQFTVPVNPAAPSQFYRLLIEQWPSRGKAFVFVNGPLDFVAMRQTYGDITSNTPAIFKPPVAVWLNNLGAYDTNGLLMGSNDGYLNGKYGNTDVYSINNPSGGYNTHGGFPLIGRVRSLGTNDFRIVYDGSSSAPKREAVIWSTEAQMYYDMNNYRSTLLNDSFIRELQLPPEIEQNLITRQYRPDLNMGVTIRSGNPIMQVLETTDPSSIQLFQAENLASVSVKTRGPYLDYDTRPPHSTAYDSEVTVGDFAGLIASWVLGVNQDFPSDAFYGGGTTWQSNVLSPLSNGLSAWTGFRYGGNAEVYKYNDYAKRIWAGRTFGGTGVPGDKGENIRNVMMFDEANTTKDGVFPFSIPNNFTIMDGPASSDLASLYIAAIFYDIAFEAGLGLHKADLLIWKTISLADNYTNFPMRAFGGKMQQAARALWPDPRPGRTGLSLYEEDINDVLTSRGIPLNGVSDFRTNLPVAIGLFPATLDVNSPSGFGSSNPNSQPNAKSLQKSEIGKIGCKNLQISQQIERGNFIFFGKRDFCRDFNASSYGSKNIFDNGYTQTNAASQDYVAYQFYKHSKYGPCDKLALTDGAFTTITGPPLNWFYNSNGTFYVELTDRELGNLVLLAPSNHIRFMTSRQRCPNEATGFYAEDVRPFGFRVIKARPTVFPSPCPS